MYVCFLKISLSLSFDRDVDDDDARRRFLTQTHTHTQIAVRIIDWNLRIRSSVVSVDIVFYTKHVRSVWRSIWLDKEIRKKNVRIFISRTTSDTTTTTTTTTTTISIFITFWHCLVRTILFWWWILQRSYFLRVGIGESIEFSNRSARGTD